MIALLARVDFVDVTDADELGDGACGTGDLPWESFEAKSLKELFEDMRSKYGRCTGKVYVGEGIPVGWVFRKRGDEWSGEGRVIDAWVSLSADLGTIKKELEGKG